MFGIAVVRDEADIVAASVRHHLTVGCERVLVVDNGSTDGTTRVLRRLARAAPVVWRSNPGLFDQAAMTTDLAHEAARAGADWVVPFDADEFWWAPGHLDLPGLLGATDAAVLRAPVVNFVQRRSQLRRSRSALRHMVYRPLAQAGLRSDVEDRSIGFVELNYPRKVAFRASLQARVAPGNHEARGIDGPVRKTEDLRCLHAPLRSRQTLVAKAARASRMHGNDLPPGSGWHLHRWHGLLDQQAVEAEWAANSYLDGHLDVYGARHPLVYDPTLRDLVARSRFRLFSGGSGAAR